MQGPQQNPVTMVTYSEPVAAGVHLTNKFMLGCDHSLDHDKNPLVGSDRRKNCEVGYRSDVRY